MIVATFVVMCVTVLWIAPVFVAASVGSNRGRTGAGVALGLCLGWIGVLLALFLPAPTPPRRFVRRMPSASRLRRTRRRW